MAINLMILPGDGIGPEVMREAQKLTEWLNKEYSLNIRTDIGLIGGASIDRHGIPLHDDVLEQCRKSDAVLLGAVGGPQCENADFAVRPEAGLLRLRKELGLFANLRPAIVFDDLAEASTLKAEIIKGLDILIVRELIGGVYFGQPRGIEDIGHGERRGFNTQSYTSGEIRRIARTAFELARKRRGKVTSCDKANVMESGKLWREEVTVLHETEFSDIQLEHIYADNCAMQLLRNPRQFDVIVTDNLFGDILSDEAAMLTGSLGMLPSASLGLPGSPGIYEPVHGSAPDIAGQGKANPLAAILSLSMAMRYSLGKPDLAAQIESAVGATVSKGIRTADIATDNHTPVSTSQMGDAVISQLENLKRN